MGKIESKIPAKVISRLAGELGKSLRTVREYVACGLPVTAKGFDPAKVQAWLRRRKLSVTGESPEDEKKWITMFRKFKAERQKLEFMKEQGKLIYRSEAEDFLQGIVENVKTDLLKGLSGRVGTAVFHATQSSVAAKDAAAATEELSRDILSRLVKKLQGLQDCTEGPSPVNTPEDVQILKGLENEKD